MRACSWENCTEPGTTPLRWRRDPDARAPVFDVAPYCEAHAIVARSHGATDAAVGRAS